ncbi:uncharacterized protein N7484_003849 [Penicillium longicatenatum]|uniref:uncharacterized protein n=1 Tax=Penicillium longicatenatum TaxID=1561947 RepID=UPI002546F75A|nr:uncharacterized protein N7484_003849 [Penicillium longicatenatum]KAJ5650126.1 hypothetical protein N7484_003849 [Penicillium longicatenatum]
MWGENTIEAVKVAPVHPWAANTLWIIPTTDSLIPKQLQVDSKGINGQWSRQYTDVVHGC